MHNVSFSGSNFNNAKPYEIESTRQRIGEIIYRVRWNKSGRKI